MKTIRLTENQLRSVIREIIKEEASGPAVLKQASQDVIVAINEENPAAFWHAVSEVIEGLAKSAQHAPHGDKMERQKFSQSIEPVWKLVKHLSNSYRESGNGKHGSQ